MAIVAVEILVEQNVILEVRVCLHFFIAIEHRPAAARVARFFEHVRECVRVRVLVDAHLCARQPRAVDDGRVVERVRDDGVAAARRSRGDRVVS